MPGRNPNVVCNKLAINPKIKLVVPKKRKLAGDKCLAVRDENEKLSKVGFIKEFIEKPT
jgi:hypothetical protein